MDTIKVGVIGCGYWGPNLIRNFIEIPDSEVMAVADLRDDCLNKIHTRYPQIQVTQNYKDLFELGLDAIVIATPPPTHFQFASEALRQGLHVLVEKPMTLNSQHAEQLVELAASRCLTLMVGHTYEYNSSVQELKHLIENDTIGQIYYMDAARLNLGLFQHGLNVLWDLAPHDISIFMYILGSAPLAISAQGMPCRFDGIHDVAYLNMIFPGNIIAHVHVSWLDPCKVRRITVVGSKKMVVYNDISAQEKIRIYDKGVDTPDDSHNYGEVVLNYRYGDVLIPNIRDSEPLRRECQHFLECIRSGRQPCSDGIDGFRVVKVLEAAQRSLVNRDHMEVLKW
jgi:predicted dehydrogenase